MHAYACAHIHTPISTHVHKYGRLWWRFHYMWWFLYTNIKPSEHLGGPGHASDGAFPPANILLKNHRFWAPRRPGVAPLRDPVPKKIHFVRKGFRARACTDLLGKRTQERLFLQRQKSECNISYRVRGMGPPQGPAFACTVTTINKTKQKKL